jgi:co-chaperonin GroES (HSP10)
MKSLNKFVVLSPIPIDSSVGSGFQMANSDKEDLMYQQGIVKIVPEAIRYLEAGDRVLYNRHTGHPQHINGEECLIIDEKGLVLILEEGDQLD